MPVDSGIPGTTLFGGDLAMKGYALNKMCYALNDEAERKSLVADEATFLDRYELTAEQRQAVEARDVLGMLDAGGNIYYLAKFAGVLGLGVQDVGALQTGTTVEEFKQRLLEAGRS